MPGNKNLAHQGQENYNAESDSISPLVSSNKADEVNSHKTSFIKRFSSFRKSDKTVSKPSSSNLINSNISSVKENIRDKMPAKFIKVTEVKKATLNPVWMEKFSLYV